jgi:predicted nuclease of predicted toxin-antitoxin system
VKLLFDENLPSQLVESLSDVYPGSAHVHRCGLGSASDEAIWEFAKISGFTIVSKDSDFEERSVLAGTPPKIIWMRTGNCASAHVAALLRSAVVQVNRFIEEDDETCLILGNRK